MKWVVVARPQVRNDIAKAADWYESRSVGLGDEFVAEVLQIFEDLEVSPLHNCRQHPTKNIRWRYPKRFPYRVIYEVLESERLVVTAAVIHAARSDSTWRSRT